MATWGRGGAAGPVSRRERPGGRNLVYREAQGPQGKILKPAVPPPIYEKDLMITVEKGRVVSQDVIDTFGGTRPPGQ